MNQDNQPKCGAIGKTRGGLITAVCSQPKGHTGNHGGMGAEWNDAACEPQGTIPDTAWRAAFEHIARELGVENPNMDHCSAATFDVLQAIKELRK